MDLQQHEMILERTYASGEEDWYCPTCGRRMTIAWHPWQKIVREPGDMYAAHSAIKGGLRVGTVEFRQDAVATDLPVADGSVEERYMAPWLRWLEKFDSDNSGKNEI